MRPIPTLSTLLALLALGGCAATTPRWDREFGATVAVTLDTQVLDRGAATRARPGDSVDGRVAKRAQEHYEQSFTDKAPAESTLMNGLAK